MIIGKIYEIALLILVVVSLGLNLFQTWVINDFREKEKIFFRILKELTEILNEDKKMYSKEKQEMIEKIKNKVDNL